MAAIFFAASIINEYLSIIGEIKIWGLGYASKNEVDPFPNDCCDCLKYWGNLFCSSI